MTHESIVNAGLELGAIKLNPEKPFLWASGYYMPIYNDNRMFLFYPSFRKMISYAFQDILHYEEIKYDFIAGTSTAGISPATTLADDLKAPMIYVRDKPKDHGLKNQIEGIDADSDLKRMKGVLIEDLISTGGSSARAVQAIRNANGICNHCLSIFNYDLDKAVEVFSSLNPQCNVYSLLNYETLLRVAKERGFIDDSMESSLREWREDPFNWGEKHGFPKLE